MIDECPYPRPTAESVCTREGFLYYVWEREAVRLARQNDLPREQWTADPVLQRYKFTNVRRRDDRVSRWIYEHLSFPRESDADLWFALLAARLINWPPTLARLLAAGALPRHAREFDRQLFIDAVEGVKAAAGKVYSGAYMVYPGKLGYANKSEFLARAILSAAAHQHYDAVHSALWRRTQSVEAVVTALAQCFGVSTFMAGQVAADLTYVPLQLGKAEDLLSYAPVGPGSSLGLNYLLGRSRYAGWAQSDFNTQLMSLNESIRLRLGMDDLTLHDVQNCACEFSKYVRAVRGEKLKTLYRAETEF